MNTRLFGLRQGNLHNLFGNALNLNVHLQRGDASLGAGHLEVHVAQVIFIAKNVSQNRKAVTFLDQAATCAFNGTPASINANEPPQTEAIEEDPLDSVISDTTRIE